MRKRQPDGGSIGFGGSPSSGAALVRRVGSMVGREASRAPRVGVLGRAVDAGGGADLDDLAEIHDHHAVAHELHHVKIVRDEHIGQSEARLEPADQRQDLRLHRLVERRDGFVEDDELRLEDERARDVDPLPLSARQLMGVA